MKNSVMKLILLILFALTSFSFHANAANKSDGKCLNVLSNAVELKDGDTIYHWANCPTCTSPFVIADSMLVSNEEKEAHLTAEQYQEALQKGGNWVRCGGTNGNGGCGSSHRLEDLEEKMPVTFSVGGRLYMTVANAEKFHAKSGSVGDMLADNGVVVNCPFCGGGSLVVEEGECSSCGADFDTKALQDAIGYQNIRAQKTVPQGDFDAAVARSLGIDEAPSSESPTQALNRVTRSDVGTANGYMPPAGRGEGLRVFIENLSPKRKRQLKTGGWILGGLMMAASLNGIYVYATDSETISAEVIEVLDKNTALVAGQSSQGYFEHEFSYPATEVPLRTPEWKIGEEVIVYNIRWGVDSGQRMNADPFVFQKDEGVFEYLGADD